jgi:hypothetical protein
MGLNEVAVGMAPPIWVHTLARLTITPSSVFPFMELGKFVSDVEQVQKMGLVTEVAPNYLFVTGCMAWQYGATGSYEDCPAGS